MRLIEILKMLGAGGMLSIFIVLSTLIEISPIKLNPIQWLGKVLTKSVVERLDATEKHVDKIEAKLDEHIASAYRTKIISFQDDIVHRGMNKTHKQWREILRACMEYEEYVANNKLINGDGTEAIEFIRAEYQVKCKTGGFLVINKPSDEDSI